MLNITQRCQKLQWSDKCPVCYQEYEVKSNTYSETLYGPKQEEEDVDSDDKPILKKQSTMAQAVQRQVLGGAGIKYSCNIVQE